MSSATPRLRMFAGPNGSGKSTLKSVLLPELLGAYLNPDEVEAALRQTGFLRLADYGVNATVEEIRPFFRSARLLVENNLDPQAHRLDVVDGRLVFRAITVNSYWASVTVDFIQRKLLGQHDTFTFETVMSHPSKVEMLLAAQRTGYRTYLYFIATDDPEINRSRVRNRVGLGGHPVPEDKIATRYHRSLALLPAAIRATNRAYIFDNSGAMGEHTWLAEITDGQILELKTNFVPAWFKRSVLDLLSK